MLGGIARGSGDLLDRTGLDAGAVLKSKNGDFVLTIDPTVAKAPRTWALTVISPWLVDYLCKTETTLPNRSPTSSPPSSSSTT